MNGRIYDPKLGRMLQADPFIQSPTNSQSLNRYSYVLNNPLSYTDPSGYFVSELFNFARAVVRIFASEGFDVTAWADLVTSAIALINAFSGQAAAFIPGIAIGSVARSGGSLSMGQGSRQSSREIEDAFRDPRIATLGGTVSEITDYRFGNGAATEAFSKASNAEVYDSSQKDEESHKGFITGKSMSGRGFETPVSDELEELWFGVEHEDWQSTGSDNLIRAFSRGRFANAPDLQFAKEHGVMVQQFERFDYRVNWWIDKNGRFDSIQSAEPVSLGSYWRPPVSTDPVRISRLRLRICTNSVCTE